MPLLQEWVMRRWTHQMKKGRWSPRNLCSTAGPKGRRHRGRQPPPRLLLSAPGIMVLQVLRAHMLLEQGQAHTALHPREHTLHRQPRVRSANLTGLGSQGSTCQTRQHRQLLGVGYLPRHTRGRGLYPGGSRRPKTARTVTEGGRGRKHTMLTLPNGPHLE